MEAFPAVASAIRSLFERQRSAFCASGPPPAAERIAKLRALGRSLQVRGREIERAVSSDFGKSPAEVALTEVFVVASEIAYACRHLRQWTRPQRVRPSLSWPGASAEVRREPRGVCLVISPWNFPFQLALGPLVSALAAGNRVILKPSELTPHTSRFLTEFLAALYDEDEVAVVEGDAGVGAALLNLPFDHIFYTGSTAVGKIVMEAASRHLSSVTLELGGKCPVILGEDADLAEAAGKIAWGKFMNAGQTCVAPDYALVPSGRLPEFVALLRTRLRKLYGAPESLPRNPDYCRIVDPRHVTRLRRLLDEAVADGATIAEGGVFATENFLSPTLVTGVAPGSPLLREEIFGPVLPIVGYEREEEAVALVNSLPPPLALFLFGRRRSWAERLLRVIPAGDAVVNDVVVHFANPRLPFGGRRASGLGKSHGEAGFRAFSHERTVMRQPRFTVMSLLAPPYTRAVVRRIRWVTRFFAGR